jgi:hypothetical protein
VIGELERYQLAIEPKPGRWVVSDRAEETLAGMRWGSGSTWSSTASMAGAIEISADLAGPAAQLKREI